MRSYARQLLGALQHLFRYGVVLSDIKPNNSMVIWDYVGVVLFDFRNAFQATYADATGSMPYLVSWFYQPPKVVLGLECNDSVDL
mmetsp:Transcript_45809/g.89539  ORF Transcript_45809/g.89539 Transcript_45809/m.89539 type:complete len:85 (+) Transcript_45809:152-406(+)